MKANQGLARASACLDAPLTRRLLATALALLVTGCGGGNSVSVAPPELPERNLAPAVVDPRVSGGTEAHVVIAPAPGVEAVNRLFVFLPGTGGIPDQYRLVLRSGANRGLHALGLNYLNPTAVGVLCNGSADADCFWDVRREIVTGTDASGLVAIAGPDAIVTRLAMAIAFLRDNFPDEGWGQFLAGTAVNWSKVVIAGHSQGGGHAGVMTKLFAMDRAVYFSSPADWSTVFNAPGAWTGRPNLTPTSRQFGFSHLEDPLVPYDEVSAIWRSMGLAAFGPAVSVDSVAPPYAGSHMLTTQATPVMSLGSVSPFHGATVIDAATPVTSAGLPIFEAVWDYLAFR